MPIAAFVLLAIIATASPSVPALTLPDIAIDTKKLRPSTVKLCSPPLLSRALVQWRPNVKAALRRVRQAAYGTERAFSVTVVPKSECATLGRYSCLGDPSGIVVCDEAVLARVLYSAAAMAGVQTLGALQRTVAPSSSEDVWTRELRAADTAEFGPMEAFGLVDAQEEDAAILGVRAPGEPTKLESRIRVLERAYGPRGRELAEAAMTAADGIRDIDTNPSALKPLPREEALLYEIMLHVYRSAVDQAMGFLLGHELAHVHGGCAVNAAPSTTVEKRVSQFVELQIDEKHFCPNPPSPSEINADRCGLVALKAVNQDWQRREKLTAVGWQIKPGFQELGNRLAIDLMGIMIVGGLGTKVHEYYRPEVSPGRIDYWPKLEESEGYLYSALRLLLATEALHLQSRSGSSGVRACGSTAVRAMEGIFRAKMRCKPEQRFTLAETKVALEKMKLPVAPRVWGVLEGLPYDAKCDR